MSRILSGGIQAIPMNNHHTVLVSHAAGVLGASAPKPNGSVTRFEIEA